MLRLLRLLAFSECLLVARAGWNIALSITRQVSGAVGGEVFAGQPRVTVFDRKGNLQSSIAGSVQAELYESPTGFERLVQNFPHEPTEPILAPVNNGEAIFSGLLLNTAGEGYKLRFTFRDEHNITLGYVVGDPFSVEIGDAYQIGIVTNPETAFGGTPWGTQPVVAVQDRGSNTILGFDSGGVSIGLLTEDNQAELHVTEGGDFEAAFEDGLAEFNGLYIDQKGTYRVQFTTALPLPGAVECESVPFSVGIGSPSELVIESDPSDGVVTGGRAFLHQPRITIVDKGGNVLLHDFSSSVSVDFFSNPSGGSLLPQDRSLVEVHGGTAQFKGLLIDKVGVNYRLRYSLRVAKSEKSETVPVQVLGNYFEVTVGQPHRIQVLNHLSDGWAGNQPFPIQPKIGLVDAGGNVVKGDSLSFVRAFLAPSLAVSTHIVIDTVSESTPHIVSVNYDTDIVAEMRQLYGSGDTIAIELVFSQEVTVLPSQQAVELNEHIGTLVRPALELDVVDDENGPSYASASLKPACVNVRSRKLVFEYGVSLHHSQPHFTYLSTSSLKAHDFNIIDGLGRNVNLTLPLRESSDSLSGSKELSIDNNAAVILEITSDHGSGEYGVGEMFRFFIQYSREVTVEGMPELPIKVNSTVAIIDTFTLGTISASSHFFIWYRDARTVKIPWDASADHVKNAIEGLSTVTGSVCVSRSASPNSISAAGNRWAVRFESLNEDPYDALFHVDASGMRFLQSVEGEMSLSLHNGDDPVLGWVTNDGDVAMCTSRVAKYEGGSGTSSLIFNYLVKPGDHAARLDVVRDESASIVFPDGDTGIYAVVNYDESESVAADLLLRSVNLSGDLALAIDSYPPYVTSIVAQESTTPNGTYAVGDTLYFEVIFTKPVSVDKGVELRLATGEVKGWAKLYSGSNSNTLVLKYDVLEGHKTPTLDYDGDDALFARNKVAGYIRRTSVLPTTDAVLTLPAAEGSTLADTSNIAVDGMRPTVVSLAFAAGHAAQTFAEGEEITIVVEFSAPVVVMSGVPALSVVVGAREREAFYASGSGSTLLKFVYTVLVGDSSVSPYFACKYICVLPLCQTKGNGVGYIRRLSSNPILDADPTLAPSQDYQQNGVPVASGANGINIDTSGADITGVVAVTAGNKQGTYGVGEEILVRVEFTDIVHCSTSKPTLFANFGATNLSMEYETGSGTNTLTFRHVVSINDATAGLNWVLYPSSDSAIFCDADAVPPCSIKNENDEDVDLRFTDSFGDLVIGQISTPIVVDVAAPKIVSVLTNKTRSQNCLSDNQFRPLLEDCVYSVGESIFIFVRFDKPVVVAGRGPHVQLNTGNHDGNAPDAFAFFSHQESNGTELVLIYEVEEGQTSSGNSLAYLCAPLDCSLDIGPSDLNSILGLASFPVLDADLRLPLPSPLGLSQDEMNPIYIDTSAVPFVTEVQALSADGVYSPGDSIQIYVLFTEIVVVAGIPELFLDVGNGDCGVAKYISGSGSTKIVFEYAVTEKDFSVDLDYVDVHSLRPGMDGAHTGSIKLESTQPTLEANLLLPSPGTVGSLQERSNIMIDTRKPHIVSISSVQSPGVYTVDDKVLILITFSLPVVVEGNPFILMETGKVDRRAVFKSNINDTTLEFEYTVELGDETDRLDYWADEGLRRSSANSFQLNGGWVRRKSAQPLADVDLHLNPSHGYLDGTGTAMLNEGVAAFVDLRIGMRGADYKIRFSSEPNSVGAEFETTSEVKIDMSIEYEIIGDQYDRDDGDLFGSSVSLDKDILAIGAPHKRNPTPEVQVLTVYSEASTRQGEVQLITTQINTTEATKQVSSFTTSADPNHAVGGTFSITCYYNSTYVYASPAVVDADVGAEQLKTIIEESFPLIGSVGVSRFGNADCKCDNGWNWKITFMDASSGMIELETSGIGLQGSGSTVSVVDIEQPTRLISGNFFLINPFTNARSRDIPYDASAPLVKEIIEADLSIKVQNIMAANTDKKRDIPGLGRRWTITFSHHSGLYGDDVNVPNLEVNGESLLGHSVIAWTHVGFEGRGLLSGYFAVSLRGSSYSDFIAHNASADVLQAALESLDSINSVSVAPRKDIGEYSDFSGSTWTITFLSVNEETDYGWLPDPGGESSKGNLPALQLDSRLIGWEAGHNIEHEFGAGDMDTQAQWMAKSRGDAGFRSGSVLVYEKHGEQWKHEAKILPSDFSSHDSFGHSVDVSDSFLVIGAPSKEVDGLSEQQSLLCVGPASGGSFVVKFRGFQSSPIPFDATANMILRAMVGSYGNTTNLHSMPQLAISGTDGWDGESDGFCQTDGNEAIITMFTPDGAGLSTLHQTAADIELLVVDYSRLNGGEVLVKEVRKGTRAFMGKDFNRTEPSGKQAGSAYLYHRHSSCKFCPFRWSQTKKVTPVDGLDVPMDSANFGWAVSSSQSSYDASQVVAIGSPGALDDSGKVYIFRGLPNSTEWSFDDALTSRVWTALTPGDRFGDSVQVEGDTILASAPGYSRGCGAVFVFLRRANEASYLSSQAIYGPRDMIEGDKFGQSIALSGNRAVICAPGKDDVVVYTGTSVGTDTANDAGACYVYERNDLYSSFGLAQKLTASNLKARDRFGSSVAMVGNTILVGQLADTTGPPVPPRPIQVLRITSNAERCTHPLGGSFRLRWQEGSSPLQTRALPFDVTANRLRDALEEDLLTGPLTVSRTYLSDFCGGYSWSVVYDSFAPFSRRISSLPILECVHLSLIGSDPACSVHSEVDIPKHGRGKAHIFTFDDVWTEQAFLFPHSPQRQDMFGSSVALSNNNAVVGAENRALLNVNSGAALIFSLQFLQVSFSSLSHTISEGGSLAIELSRTNAEHQQITRVRSVDINAEESFQHFVHELFSLRSSQLFPLDRTPVDLLTDDTAIGRDQYYGSTENRSVWVDAIFDYRGISDYDLVDELLIMDVGELTTSALLQTTDDHIYEFPDENLTLHVNLPGMFASQLGGLATHVRINDNGDGYSGEEMATYYTKVQSDAEGNRFGSAIDVDGGVMVVGSEFAIGRDIDGTEFARAGAAFIYLRKSGSWILSTTVTASPTHIAPNGLFGQSVAVSTPYGREDSTVLVGAPGQAAAFIFVFEPSTGVWQEQAVLHATDEELSSQHGFAAEGALALYGDIAFVGSPVTETVYAFRRTFIQERNVFEWVSWSVLRSSAYDYDVYDNGFTIKHVHMQHFGAALAANRRALMVGAPYADYGNQGNLTVREKFNTDGVDNKHLGKGKVFAFHSIPHAQLVLLACGEEPSAGSFRLALIDHLGTTSQSGIISYTASATQLKVALEQAENVGEIEVTKEISFDENRPDTYRVEWSITFLSEINDHLPLLTPLWEGHGCFDCEKIQLSSLSIFSPSFDVSILSTQHPFIEEGALQADDRGTADGFGLSLAVDGKQAIVGSRLGAARTRTTWNFETGTIIGWTSTGDAFDFQPTFGDNSRQRAVYDGFGGAHSETSGEPQSSNMRGRYSVGTYERRPGSGNNAYQMGNQEFMAGSSQGDLPVGTLTSDPFIILGRQISFLVGGGCNHLTVYVELLVDGFVVTRATGKCVERMERVKWDVSRFVGRAAQFRIVDADSGKWGHINVDEIQFSWDVNEICFNHVNEECINGGGALPRQNAKEKQHYTRPEDSAASGSAYLFFRNCDVEHDKGAPFGCVWVQQQRIVASDKRPGNLFGFSVDVDDIRGIALVGSAAAPSYGLFHEQNSIYPHTHPTLVDFPLSENMENSLKSGHTQSALGGFLMDQVASDKSVKYYSKEREMHLSKYNEEAGALYVFKRIPAVIDDEGNVVKPQYWQSTEDAKIVPPDIGARDTFGHSVALSGFVAVASAIGAGASFLFDLRVLSIGFSKTEYVALEGIDPKVKIILHRDLSQSSTRVTVGYSTSDLTARGVDSLKFEECQSQPVPTRLDCGDYEQTAGELTFLPGVESTYFEVRIMNDFCSEPHLEYIQLNLHLPGGGPLHGEHYRALLRVDDDDLFSTSEFQSMCGISFLSDPFLDS